jgi:co-chaperonin GroES (HSP10)
MTVLRAVGDKIIVDPRSEADRVYSLVIPESAKNPMPQQGEVVAVGPQQKDIQAGDYVLFHPFTGEAVEPTYLSPGGYLVLQPHNIAAFLTPDGELFPLPDFVMILPDFKATGVTKQGSLWLPKQVFEVEPPETGIIARIGSRVTTVHAGQKVVYPLHAGNEIGLDTGVHRGVYYTMKADDLLAIVG